MRSLVVPFLLLAAVAPAAGAQVTPATVDPGMTKAQVVERLGAPAAERSRGNYTYLFYENGCERECGMTDLVTLESDTVVDAIFRAPHRTYAGISSSPVATTPSGARASLSGGGALAVPARGAARQSSASMAMEFADLLGNPAPAADAESSAPAPAARTDAKPAAASSMAAEFADLLGNPAPAATGEPDATPARAATPAAAQTAQAAAEVPAAAASVLSPDIAALLGNPTPPPADAAGAKPAVSAQRAATPAREPAATPARGQAATSVLSPEISALLGNPAAASGAANPSTDAVKTVTPAASILGDDITSLLRDPDARPPANPGAAATTPPTEAKPVQEPSRPDTISSSGDRSARGAQTARPTWPPPRDSSAAKPPSDKPAADPPKPSSPDSTKPKEQSKPGTWTTWPPPAR